MRGRESFRRPSEASRACYAAAKVGGSRRRAEGGRGREGCYAAIEAGAVSNFNLKSSKKEKNNDLVNLKKK